MRRLKMVVYFLILGILSSLLGNVSFAWASTQDKLTITEIYDLEHRSQFRQRGDCCSACLVL